MSGKRTRSGGAGRWRRQAPIRREHHERSWLRVYTSCPGPLFILIGESGQQNLANGVITLTYLGRMEAILIREIAGPRRCPDVPALAPELSDDGVPVSLGATFTELAARIATLGLTASQRVGASNAARIKPGRRRRLRLRERRVPAAGQKSRNAKPIRRE